MEGGQVGGMAAGEENENLEVRKWGLQAQKFSHHTQAAH